MRPRGILFGALLLASVWACLWTRHNAPNKSVAPAAPPGDERAAALLTDDLERTTQVRVPSRRIASLHPAFTEMIEALGAVSNLVGVTAADSGRLGLPALGSHVKPDLEALLACRPDLILLPARHAGLAAEIEARAAEAGAAVLAWQPVTVAQTLERVRDLGRILDRRGEAAAIVEKARAGLALIAARLKDTPPDAMPSVFLEARATPSLLTCGRDSVAYDIIRLAGGRMIAELPGAVAPVDIEAVVRADPDVYIRQTGAMNTARQSLTNHPVLGRLRAVRSGRVYRLEEALISRPGPRAADAVAAVHFLLYNAPERREQ